jgi:hypothetical protein
MKRSRAALLVLVGLGGSTTALARQADGSPSRSDTGCFVAADADGDGRVTLLEARAAAQAWFDTFDRDGDGQVTRNEANEGAPVWRAARFEARFSSLDRDGDGMLSRSESNLPLRRFGWADRNADRALSRAELSRAFLRGPGGDSDTAALRSRFWRRDTNHDGVVTRAEALAAAERHFARRDRNGDGVVLPGEARGSSGR